MLALVSHACLPPGAFLRICDHYKVAGTKCFPTSLVAVLQYGSICSGAHHSMSFGAHLTATGIGAHHSMSFGAHLTATGIGFCLLTQVTLCTTTVSVTIGFSACPALLHLSTSQVLHITCATYMRHTLPLCEHMEHVCLVQVWQVWPGMGHTYA